MAASMSHKFHSLHSQLNYIFSANLTEMSDEHKKYFDEEN